MYLKSENTCKVCGTIYWMLVDEDGEIIVNLCPNCDYE